MPKNFGLRLENYNFYGRFVNGVSVVAICVCFATWVGLSVLGRGTYDGVASRGGEARQDDLRDSKSWAILQKSTEMKSGMKCSSSIL